MPLSHCNIKMNAPLNAKHERIRRIFFGLAIIVILYGCGGGGGGSNDAVDTSTNTAPVANAGADQTVDVGSTVTLSGAGSFDADGDILTYTWSLTSTPANSVASLSSTATAATDFVADLDGTYIASLIVNDDTANSAADTVSITATTNTVAATNELNIPPLLTGPEFSLIINDTDKIFFPDVAGSEASQTYGYNDEDFMGPTLIFNKDEVVSIEIFNATESDNVTVHWHGFHLPAQWDGGPLNSFLSGETWSPTFTVMQNASTMWYHSHIHGDTARQVSRGMLGMIIIRDDVEALLDLPRTYGTDDIPIIMQDLTFNDAGVFGNAFLGATMVLNGTVEPSVDVPQQVVRFRFLNASIERVYNVGFSDNRNFYQIATDGGLLEAPVTLTRVVVSPGERVELLLDFTTEAIGAELTLNSFSTEFGGSVAGSCNDGGPACGNGPLDAADFPFLEMTVVAQTANAVTTIPSSLVTINFLDEFNADGTSNVDETRVKRLLPPAGPGLPFTINGGAFAMDVINDTIPLGNTEIWEFINESTLGHPMHLHDVQFNILRVNGLPPEANLTGWKDTVMVYPGETTEVLAEFVDFSDETFTYMMHCHALNHEDNGMMEQFRVVPVGFVSEAFKEIE